LTFDDGSINQFHEGSSHHEPALNSGDLFFHNWTNTRISISGKVYWQTLDQIIAETATVPTNKDNFFERASAIGFLGL
jgi:hypothetical protein